MRALCLLVKKKFVDRRGQNSGAEVKNLSTFFSAQQGRRKDRV